MTALPVSLRPASPFNAQALFLEIKPRIEAYAKRCFRHIWCTERRADLVAEAVALAWRMFVSLAQRGRDARHFVIALARYAVRAVRGGRLLCGQLPANDAMSERAQVRHGFRIVSLSDPRHQEPAMRFGLGWKKPDFVEDTLQEHSRSPVADQAAFRVDFRDWLRTRTDRERRLIGDMARNERTTDLAARYALTPGRISQLRREFHEDWGRFCAGLKDGKAPVSALD